MRYWENGYEGTGGVCRTVLSGDDLHPEIVQRALLAQHQRHIQELVAAAVTAGTPHDPYEDPMADRQEQLLKDVELARKEWSTIWDLLVEKPRREAEERKRVADREDRIQSLLQELARGGVITLTSKKWENCLGMEERLPAGVFIVSPDDCFPASPATDICNKYAILPETFLASCAKARESKSGDKKNFYVKNCFPCAVDRTLYGEYPAFDVAQGMGAIYTNKRGDTMFVRNVDFKALFDAFVEKHLKAGTGYWTTGERKEEVSK